MVCLNKRYDRLPPVLPKSQPLIPWQPLWYPLKSKKPESKKDSIVTGSIQLHFSLIDKSAPNASPQDVLQKLYTIIGVSQTDLNDEEFVPDQGDQEYDEGMETNEPEPSGEQDTAPEAVAKKKKRLLRIAKIKNKVKEKGYEFTNGSPIAGVLFIEIQKCTDLPPERNGEFSVIKNSLSLKLIIMSSHKNFI